MAMTAGTKHARHRVGQALDRRAAALGLGHHLRRCARAASRRRRARRGSRGCRCRSRCRRSRVSPGPFSAGMGSPVTIDSSTALRPSSTTPSTGTFSPGRTRRRSPRRDRLERHVLLAAVVRQAPRRLRRQAEERADGRAGAAARAQLEHLAQQHQRHDHRGRLEVDRHAGRPGSGRPAGRAAAPASPRRCSRRRRRCRARSA